MEEEEADQMLFPPLKYSLVMPGIYRSGYPNRKNFPFLKRLGLKSVLYLCPEDLADDNTEFLRQNGIKLLHYGIEGNKEPFVNIPPEVIRAALRDVLGKYTIFSF
jgi:tyrosine-protein phosphatase SIW14